RPGVKTVPDRGLTSARALQPPAQPRQTSPKAGIVRGSLMSSITASYIAPSHPGCGMFFYATPVADSKMMRKNSQVMDLRLAVENWIRPLARPGALGCKPFGASYLGQ